MTPDERNLLLLLARMVQKLAEVNAAIPPKGDRELRAAIARVEAAEDRAADEEKINGRG